MHLIILFIISGAFLFSSNMASAKNFAENDNPSIQETLQMLGYVHFCLQNSSGYSSYQWEERIPGIVNWIENDDEALYRIDYAKPFNEGYASAEQDGCAMISQIPDWIHNLRVIYGIDESYQYLPPNAYPLHSQPFLITIAEQMQDVTIVISVENSNK